MSHFAKVRNGIVEQVIIAEQDFIDKLPIEDGVSWVQTSYNTHQGQHKGGGQPLRKNYAGIGYTYDKVRDAFIPPKPFNSWILDEAKGIYKAPKPIPPIDIPNKRFYRWNEELGDWEEWDGDASV